LKTTKGEAALEGFIEDCWFRGGASYAFTDGFGDPITSNSILPKSGRTP